MNGKDIKKLRKYKTTEHKVSSQCRRAPSSIDYGKEVG